MWTRKSEISAVDPEETFAQMLVSDGFAAEADLGLEPCRHLKVTRTRDRPMFSEVPLVATN